MYGRENEQRLMQGSSFQWTGPKSPQAFPETVPLSLMVPANEQYALSGSAAAATGSPGGPGGPGGAPGGSTALPADRIVPIDTVVASEYFANAAIPNTLRLLPDDVIYVLSKPSDNWWDGVTVDPFGSITRGWFPPSHTKPQTQQLSRKGSSLSYSASTMNHSMSIAQLPEIEAYNTASSSKEPKPLHLVSTDDIASLFQTANTSSQPTFAFTPLWLPMFTADDDVVYHNQNLNVYTRELPLIATDNPYTKSKASSDSGPPPFDWPDTTKYAAGYYTLPQSLGEAGADGLGGPGGEKQTLTQFQNQFANGVDGAVGELPQVSIDAVGAKDSQKYGNVAHRLLTDFYLSSSDITTWETLNAYFQKCVESALEALAKGDNKMFHNALNYVCTTVSTYQMVVRLLSEDLKESTHTADVSSLLTRLTSSLVQFIINGNLHMMVCSDGGDDNTTEDPDYADDESEPMTPMNFSGSRPLTTMSYESMFSFGSQTSLLAPTPSPRAYLRQAQKDGAKMIRRSVRISDIFLGLKQDEEKDPNGLPILYARFIRNQFEAGGFTNQFAHEDEDPAAQGPHRKSNILLDDNVVKELSTQANTIAQTLVKTGEILDAPVPENLPYPQYLQNRNLSILTSMYHCIPLVNQYLETIEAIDFTLFQMIRKMAEEVTTTTTAVAATNGVHSMSGPPGMPQHFASAATPSIFGGDTESTTGSEYLQSSVPEDPNRQFYEMTTRNLGPLLTEFVHLKQELHEMLSDLILDCQMLTTADPEVFYSCRLGTDEDDERARVPSSGLRTEQFGRSLAKDFQSKDNAEYHGHLYEYEPAFKLRASLRQIPEKLSLMLISVTQLRDQRQSILTYCSRLMNTDFSVASLFIAERHNTTVSGNSQSEYYYGGRKDERAENEEDKLPWFLDLDADEKQLIYDPNGLKGGPVKSLVAKLLDPIRENEPEFAETLFLMFRTFTTPEELFALLLETLNQEVPESLSYEEYNVWVKRKQQPQQAIVLQVVEKLLRSYWHVNYSTKPMKAQWELWCGDAHVSAELAALGKNVLAYTDQDQYASDFGTADAEHVNTVLSTVPPALSEKVKRIRLHNLDINVVAQQLTVLQAEYFCKINRTELFARSFNFNRIFHKNNAIDTTNIANFVKSCNDLTHFVVYMILRQVDIIQRVSAIKYFVKLAEKLMDLRNFSSMTAIISALDSTSVSRIKNTWALVPKATIRRFEKMDNLMSIGKNYSEYRNILKFIADDGDPCLPFLGMFLSDLRFTTDGNPNHIHGDKNLVNFQKRSAICKVVNEVLQFSEHRYRFPKDIDVVSYFLVMFENMPDDETLYEMSIKREPRVSLVNQNADGVPQNGAKGARATNRPAGNSMLSRVTNAAKKMNSTAAPPKKRYSSRPGYGV